MKRAATFDGCLSWLIAYSPSKTSGPLAADLRGSSKFNLKRRAKVRQSKSMLTTFNNV